MPSRLTRRRFLAASAAVAAAPYVKAYAPGEPKDKVRLAIIGVGNRGAGNLAGIAAENLVAICDVDPQHAVKARAQFPKAEYFTDYRKMLDAVANKVDAVVVSTPDHTHAHPSLIAMGLGKHLYCEKPLAHTVEEVRLVRQTAKDKKLVTQMGTQIHAGDNYRRVVEIVRSGMLGPISRVQVWLSRKPDAAKRVDSPVKPIKFDIDQWLGPVPHEFFYAKHSEHNGGWPHWNWRYWWAFGGGTLADFGCHYMDLPYWALNLGAPTRVKSTGTKIPDADNDVPNTQRVDYHYAASGKNPAVHMTWYHGVPGPDDGQTKIDGFPSGVLFEGEAGQLVAGYSNYRFLPDSFAQVVKPPRPTIAKSVGHHQEWLDAIRAGGGPTTCNFGYSGTLAEAVLLGNVAYRAGREIAWDAAAGKTDSPEADKFLKWEVRKGWELK
ncbi:MAG TPA: Gfo/Idh/MocA family oxidoreductase [Fimbriiglobus sp.]|jgi:predicted dehydrogenase|nr:Gfo/Idh/MocA family oxidoreductase [Fimbriiglobus sp.]